MVSYILYDTEQNWKNLLPLSYTRSIADFRLGILTIKEKWELLLIQKIEIQTIPYLQKKYPFSDPLRDEIIIINSSLPPNEELISMIKSSLLNNSYYHNDIWLFSKISKDYFANFNPSKTLQIKKFTVSLQTNINPILFPEDIFQNNAAELKLDYAKLTKGKTSQPISPTNQVTAPENIFLEEGAIVECAILNAKNGPIYIGKNAEIMEGSAIRGGLALCHDATLSMGTKVYGATTIGPYSKMGGEIKNVVVQAYSNKSHDGYLGNAIIGEWCNIGAATNASNLKNNYSEVRLWNYNTENFRKTGTNYLGLIMGDHSKCGINTMFNTGTLVGIGTNVYGAGYPRVFIPSFAWGGKSGFQTNKLNKCIEVAELVMKRRNKSFTQIDREILQFVYEYSSKYRKWEN